MNKIEAIKEALAFIRETWIGNGTHWRGTPDELVSATLSAEVTERDIHQLVEAANNGEPTPVKGVRGTIQNGKLVAVTVTK